MRNQLCIISILVLFHSAEVDAATCSCAGVPLSNSIDLTNYEEEKIQIGIRATISDISDLYAGSNQVNDESGRKRKTNSYLAQISYGINEMWGLTGLVSWVNHTRNIAISNTVDENSHGIGDSVVVLSYTPERIGVFNKNEWAFGVGIRLPTGINDNGNPITYAEDLQPGQGAWGKSLWGHFGHAFSQEADWITFVDVNYIDVGENARGYSYQDEWNIASGLSYTTDSVWNYRLALTYRKANHHTKFGGVLPNTGGSWLDFVPSVQYRVSKKLSFGFSASLPVHRDLNGVLQFTTKNSVTFSMNYNFD